MKLLINRLREPSTWAGISAIGLLFGLDAVKLNAIAQAGVAVAGAAAIFLPEQKGGQ